MIYKAEPVLERAEYKPYTYILKENLMKKRVLSMFMALALCLTLLPAPVRAAEDTPESGAIAAGAAGGNFARRIRTGWNE